MKHVNVKQCVFAERTNQLSYFESYEIARGACDMCGHTIETKNNTALAVGRAL